MVNRKSLLFKKTGLLRSLRSLAMTKRASLALAVAILLSTIHSPLSTLFAAPSAETYYGGAGDGWSYGESINTGLGGTVSATISSSQDQGFYVGKEPTTAKTITITDTTGGTVTASGNLRIRIPSTFNMTWYYESDVSDSAFTIGNKPTVTFNSAAELTNGSGKVATSVAVADVDGNNTCKLKVEYSTNSTNGTDGTWLDPTIEAGTITATFGSPALDNGAEYQIGTAAGWILTSSGSNSIGFNWLSKTDLPTTDDTSVWLRFTASDGTFTSTIVPSTAFSIDNVAPISLANLAAPSVTVTSATLTWTAASDTYFNHYEIWYGTVLADVTSRSGTALEWDNDPNDANLALATTTTTTITGLSAGLTYYFKIWAVDNAGNEMTTTEVSKMINNPPVGGYTADNVIPAAQCVQATDGTGLVTISFRAKDADLNNCTLNTFKYSVDGGVSFNAPTNGDSSGALSTGWTNNNGLNYASATGWLGTMYSFTFNTKHANVTGLNSVDQSDVQVQFLVNDGMENSLGPTVSASFRVDDKNPLLSNWTLDMNAGIIALTFDETIDASQTDVTKMIVQDAATATSGKSYTLTNSTPSGTNSTTITVTLSSANLNAIKAIEGLAKAEANSYIRFAAAAVKDLFKNSIAAVADGSAVKCSVGGYTADITAPMLSNWTLNMHTHQLTLNFSESVKASSWTPTAVTLQDIATAPTKTYALTAGSTTASANGTQIVVTLSTTDFNAIIDIIGGGLCTALADSFLTMTASAITDMAATGNAVSAVTTGTQAAGYIANTVTAINFKVLTSTYATSTTMTAGATKAIVIRTYDANGYRCPSYAGSGASAKTLVFSGAANSPDANVPTARNNSAVDINFASNTTIDFTNGEGSSTLRLYNRQTALIKATDEAPTPDITTPTGYELTIVVGPEIKNKLVFTQQPPSTGTINVALTPAPIIEIRDVYGNRTDDTDSITLYDSTTKPTFNDGLGTLANATVSAVAGTATFSAVAYNRITSIYLQAKATGLTSAWSDGTITFSAAGTTTVDAAATPVVSFNLLAINDTEPEKFAALKFKITDAGGDQTNTLIDQLKIAVAGTGGLASTDIAWAGLYKTGGTVLVQTATSIANDYITFGSALNADSTASLDTVLDGTNTEYTLFIYMKAGKLIATDTKTYTFGVNEGLVGVDSGTSSQMWTPARTAVATVVATVKVDVTYLEVLTAAGAASASTTAGTALELQVRGVDVNKNIDIHYGLAPDGENKTLRFSGLNSIGGNDPLIEAAPFGANITISFLNGLSAANAVTLTAYKKETQNLQAAEYDAFGVSKYLAYPLAITVDALKATVVSATSGDGQVGKTSTALPTPLLVTATDTYGNTVDGVSVSFAITAPADGAVLSVSTGTTDAVGQVSTVLTLGSVSKTYTVTATATGPVEKVLGAPSANFTATGRTPTAISKTGDNQSQNISTVLTNSFMAKLVDAAANPIPNESITFAFPTGGYPTGATGQAISVSSGTTNSSGQVSTLLTLGNKIGSYIVRATYSGGPTITTDFTALATTTGPSKVALSGPSSITAAAASSAFTINITDDTDNAANITDAAGVTFSLTGSTGAFYSDSACTTVITTQTVPQNASSSQFYYKQTAAGSITLTAAYSSGQTLSTKSTDSKAVDIVPADLNHFRLSAASSSLTAGVSTTLTIKAYDVYNNLRTNFSGALSVRFKFNDILAHSSPAGNNPTCGAGTIGNNTTGGDIVSLSFTSGTATASLILYKPETALVLKAYTDSGITTPDAYDLDVTSVQHNTADHTKLSGNLPTPQTVGVAFNFGRFLNVVDAYDNICDGANGATAYNETPTGNNLTWTLSGTANAPDGSQTDSFIRQVSFTNGVSTTALSATLYRAQDTTLTAAVAGVPATGSPVRANQASNIITVTAGAINKLWFSVEPSSTGITSQALTPYQPSVSVADQYGNATSAAGSITLAAYLNNTGADTAGNGTLSSDSANNTKALTNGVAAFSGVKYSYPETIYLKATVTGQSLTAVYSTPVTLSVATDLSTTAVTTSSTISSLKNVAADKVTVYEFKVTDAGTDGRDAGLTKLVINRDYGTGGGDTAGDWTNYINGAYITDGTTQVIGIIAANTITFGDASSTIYTVSNATFKTFSLKLTLKTSLPVGADGKKLGFTMDANTDISLGSASSTFPAVNAITGTATVTVAATDLVVTGTATMTAGGSNTITITAKDANANIDLDYENLVTGKTLTFSGANASPDANNPTCQDYGANDIAFGTATNVRFTAGVGTSTMKLYKAEIATISATDGTVSTQSGSTLSVTVSSSTIAKLSWSTQPTANVVSSAPWKSFVLAVADTYGNTLTSSTESVTIALSGATGDVAISASATKTATASAGVATFTNFYVTGTGTSKLVASAGAYSSAISSTVTVAATYTINITVKDSFSNATLTDVQLGVTEAGVTKYGPTTSRSGTFSFSLAYGTYIFSLKKEAYVDSDTESTTTTAADGTDGTYDNIITWTLTMTSVTEATADYKVMSSFIYDEVGEDLTTRLWLERRGILIVNSAMNILGNATVDVYDSVSAAWLTTITISPPAASDTTTGTYTTTVENVLSASSSFGAALTSGKSYFAKCKISYGGTTGTRKTYEAGTTFTISVTEKLSRQIIEKLGNLGEGETLVSKIAEVKGETTKIVTATETTIPDKVAKVKDETAKILTAAETTIPAKVDEAKTAISDVVKSEILNRENTVRLGQAMTIRYRTYTGLIPTIDVYDASNVLKVEKAAMTEIGTTGIYEKTVTFESAWGRGDFSIVCSESTKGTMDAMTISVLRTDMEQVYGQVSSILGNTSGITGLRTVADSLNNQFAVIESVLSRVGKNLVAQVKEAASSALGLESIFTQLANVAKQVKQISGEAGINLEKLYQVSVDKKQDIDYLKNKTQQLKASVEMSTKMVDNIANKPITQTWYEYKK